MAEGKKSFVLYCDIIHVIKKLPKEKAGELFMTILEYVNDKSPEVTDLSVDLVFEPIKQQLKRDLKKWDNYIEKQRLNGEKGGRPKNPTLLTETQPLIEKPKKADSVNVNVNDSVNVTEEVGGEKVKEVANEVWKDQNWRDSLCMGLSLSTEELKKWLAMFNSSIASDKVPDFDKGKYKKMSRGWIVKQQSKGVTVETNGRKKSDSAPLTTLN